jgi:hypothetical protein
MGVCDPKPALNSFSLPQPNWATIKTSQYIYKSGAWDYDVLVINCSASCTQNASITCKTCMP